MLEYPKIQKVLKQSDVEASSVMATILSLSSLVDVTESVHAIPEDPSDNHVLACAKKAGAQIVISGDRHLLQLGNYDDVRILTASRFIEQQSSNH